MDTFLVFDHVQAARGKGWLSRNALLIGGEKRWLTMPTKKSGKGKQRINEVEINYSAKFARKHLRTIESNYSKTKYFHDLIPFIEELYKREYRLISDFNFSFIKWVCELLEINSTFIFSTDLVEGNPGLSKLAGNELILELCLSLSADEYLSGSGCLDFIDPQSFKDAGVDFCWQEFEHPNYLQIGSKEFVSHLSILDALFNVGPAETQCMVCQSTVLQATK